jgi:DNA-binding FadR family transcriptional regulator
MANVYGSRPIGSSGISLHLKLLNELGRSIVRGDLQPGTPLPNGDDWSAAHGVSRTVLREVVKVLAGKGMVESRPKIGTRIRPRSDWNFLDPDVLGWRFGETVNFEDARALFELRRAIEPMAASLAAERATPADIDALMQVYGEMEQSADDNERFAQWDLSFHQAMLRMTHNELFVSLGSLTESALLISFRMSDHNPLGQRPSLPLHFLVCDCIAKHDPIGARDAMLDLLDKAEQDVDRSLGTRRDRHG